MYKSSIFFQNIDDLPSFEAFLSKQILPDILESIMVSRVRITNIVSSVKPVPKSLSPLQVIVDLYFESLEDIHIFMESPIGKQLINSIVHNPWSNSATFFGHETIYYPRSYQTSRKTSDA